MIKMDLSDWPDDALKAMSREIGGLALGRAKELTPLSFGYLMAGWTRSQKELQLRGIHRIARFGGGWTAGQRSIHDQD